MELSPDFNERDLGFRKFSKFLVAAANKGLPGDRARRQRPAYDLASRSQARRPEEQRAGGASGREREGQALSGSQGSNKAAAEGRVASGAR